MNMIKVGDGIFLAGEHETREVAYVSNEKRVIVKYDGLLLVCDKDSFGIWDFSGSPAVGAENEFIIAHMQAKDTTDVTVTKS
jgi:hypothetical protein